MSNELTKTTVGKIMVEYQSLEYFRVVAFASRYIICSKTTKVNQHNTPHTRFTSGEFNYYCKRANESTYLFPSSRQIDQKLVTSTTGLSSEADNYECVTIPFKIRRLLLRIGYCVRNMNDGTWKFSFPICPVCYSQYF